MFECEKNNLRDKNKENLKKNPWRATGKVQRVKKWYVIIEKCKNEMEMEM